MKSINEKIREVRYFTRRHLNYYIKMTEDGIPYKIVGWCYRDNGKEDKFGIIILDNEDGTEYNRFKGCFKRLEIYFNKSDKFKYGWFEYPLNKNFFVFKK